jgi:hypothetical protein
MLGITKRKNMEALVLALIIVRNQYRQRQSSLPEADEFQLFDLQALRHSYNAEEMLPGRPLDRQQAYAAQAVS